eukprot:CAMPEP_0119398102 /NCGR_PEP_ID=MMETSP1334-20130426/140671_1 /TAXON_ID=127549 /ORGANISM="Calcidiscus leptoporus, Strain RCC1130" /LENGTH=259 /DNA_ID=CAMNT_0007421957 /DNA_START=508 /DNA_END=1288 /DNA_ORIENTATION=-
MSSARLLAADEKCAVPQTALCGTATPEDLRHVLRSLRVPSLRDCFSGGLTGRAACMNRCLVLFGALSSAVWIIHWIGNPAEDDNAERLVCGDALFIAATFAALLTYAVRQVWLRKTLEASACAIEVENAKLRLANTEMLSNLTLLQTTIGAIGTESDRWFEQLRHLSADLQKQRRQQALLLRGQAVLNLLLRGSAKSIGLGRGKGVEEPIFLLMSRQTRSHCANDACGQVRMWILLHVDVDHDFKINTTELTTLKQAQK